MKFKVWSRTDTSKWYAVETNHAGGVTHCTCKSFKERQTCWHATAVESNPSSYALLEVGTIANDLAAVGAKPLPMLAKSWNGRITPDTYAVEEKFDGHRAVLRYQDGAFSAWSRTGIDCLKKFSPGMLSELKKFSPSGSFVLDGEIVRLDGGRSYSVSHLQHKHLTFVVFDVLELMGFDTTPHPYDVRRSYLIEMFNLAGLQPDVPIQLVQAFNPADNSELNAVISAIWDRGGEGVIVKHRKGIYRPGKRTDAFAKVKECQRAVLTLRGFVPSTGEIKDRGTAATAVLLDAEGNYTVVKTGSDENCEKLAARFTNVSLTERIHIGSRWVECHHGHQDVGRRVMIEFHERTPDGSYRSPRWDRFEDE